MENNQSYDHLNEQQLWEKIEEKLNEMWVHALTELRWSEEYKHQRGLK